MLCPLIRRSDTLISRKIRRNNVPLPPCGGDVLLPPCGDMSLAASMPANLQTQCAPPAGWTPKFAASPPGGAAEAYETKTQSGPMEPGLADPVCRDQPSYIQSPSLHRKGPQVNLQRPTMAAVRIRLWPRRHRCSFYRSLASLPYKPSFSSTHA